MASAPTNLSIPGTRDPLYRMHVTRPKSAKGRTRTNPQGFTHNVESYSYRTSPTPPQVSTVRAPSTPRIGQEDFPELLHQLPYRPPSSTLNRYRVLPSIRMASGRVCTDDEELAQIANNMKLTSEQNKRLISEPQEWQVKTLYRDQAQPLARMEESSQHQRPQGRPENIPVLLNIPEPTDQEPRLLLAIRSHSGQRFERYFRPTDTLHTVLAAAEEKTGLSCKDCSVESMEVPRRSFPNLSWTLQQCGIPNKSVLCIHQGERE
ncbi:UBX domain-containing protein 10 isoform 1-T2 [Rhinophrynus dorsalis]